MNCEYPCHICDPEAWEEERNPPRDWSDLEDDIAKSFDESFRKMELAYIRAATGILPKGNGPKWWRLLTPWPEDIAFGDELEHEDFYALYGDVNPRRLLTANRVHMETGGRRYPIQAYRQRADFEKRLFWVDAIQVTHPPSWGWWMPDLGGL